jgi:hypothetical protein
MERSCLRRAEYYQSDHTGSVKGNNHMLPLYPFPRQEMSVAFRELRLNTPMDGLHWLSVLCVAYARCTKA